MEKIEPTVKTVEEEFAEAASGEQSERLNVNVNNNGAATRESLATMRSLIIAVFAPVVVIGAILVYFLFRSVMTEPPLTYDSLVITSGDKVCPGDTLIMTLTGRITDAPFLVTVVSTIADTETGRNVVHDEHPDWLPLDRVRSFINPYLTYILPTDLPPGDYEFRRSAQGFQGRMSMISVPFTVLEDCEQATYLPMRSHP